MMYFGNRPARPPADDLAARREGRCDSSTAVDLMTSFVDYDNARRSHMEREHLPPVREESDEVAKFKREAVEVKSYVGGLVPSFERKIA